MQAQDTRPKLELSPQVDFNGGSFQPVSGSMTGGLGMEDRFLWHVSGTYRAAKKATYCNDVAGTCVVNPHGDSRTLEAQVGYRSGGGWLAIAGGSFTSLHTTLYDKTGSEMTFGGGKDLMHDTWSARLTAEYVIPLPLGHTNVEHGFKVHFTMPSESATDHWIFFDETFFAGWVCDPKCGRDASLTMGPKFRF